MQALLWAFSASDNGYLFCELIMPRWTEPWRHTVVVVCVCMSLALVSLQRLKGKR